MEEPVWTHLAYLATRPSWQCSWCLLGRRSSWTPRAGGWRGAWQSTAAPGWRCRYRWASPVGDPERGTEVWAESMALESDSTPASMQKNSWVLILYSTDKQTHKYASPYLDIVDLLYSLWVFAGCCQCVHSIGGNTTDPTGIQEFWDAQQPTGLSWGGDGTRRRRGSFVSFFLCSL